MNTPETAPKTGEVFLGDFGYPWWEYVCWCERDKLWVFPELNMDDLTNPYFEMSWEHENKLKGWIPLPENV